MDFIYDNNGAPYAMKYDGTEYYYVLNLQGDVIRIIDTTGASVAEYIYDAWGRPVSATGTMAEVNPIRYRGYYFDSDSGLYYLQSRYYDPEIKRFINADSSDLPLVNPSGLTDKNPFSYCDNNPVSRKDDGGQIWNFVVGAVVGGLLGGVSAALDGGSAADIITGAASGAVGGLVAASGLGIAAQALITGAAAGVGKSISIGCNSGFKSLCSINSIQTIAKTTADAMVCSLAGSAVGYLASARGITKANKVLTSAYNKANQAMRSFSPQNAKTLIRSAYTTFVKGVKIQNFWRGVSSVAGSVTGALLSRRM